MRLAVAAAAVLLLAACGGPGAAPGTPPPSATPTPWAHTGIDVVAREGPTCPVERVGAPPCVRPVRVRVDVTSPSGAVAASVTTGDDGLARIALVPGAYTVSGRSEGGTFPRPPAPVTVRVAAGAYTEVTLDFDTGIR